MKMLEDDSELDAERSYPAALTPAYTCHLLDTRKLHQALP